MSRGRKAHADPPVDVMVSIPTTLNAKIELLLYDPLTQKPKYGGRSALIQQLLREWIERQQKVLTLENKGNSIESTPPQPLE